MTTFVADLEASAGRSRSDTPKADWTVEQLGHYAAERHGEIEAGEQALAAAYWELGRALNLAFEQVEHGGWEQFLTDHGIDKTRAFRARAIHKTFPRIKQVKELTVEAAFAKRERKARTDSEQPQQASGSSHCGELLSWLEQSLRQADKLVEDAEIDGSAAAQLLEPTRAVLARLRDVEARLAELAGSSAAD